MDKFGRNYILEVEKKDGTFLVVQLPFTIEFDVIRNTLSSANVFQVRIYNLSRLNRDQIRFNVYEYATLRRIRLRAGYGNSLATICKGNITQAWSVREGTNFITQIESYDGGFAFANGTTETQFPSGSAQRTVVTTLMKSLPNTTLGAVGAYRGTLQRGNSYDGNTIEILDQITGGGFFIDNEKANALGTDEYIAAVNGTVLINAQSGLLGTPVLENNIVRFDMLFEPGLNIGHRITLQSLTEASFDGDYKITGVKHRGMISEAVCGSVVTTGEFLRFKDLIPAS